MIRICVKCMLFNDHHNYFSCVIPKILIVFFVEKRVKFERIIFAYVTAFRNVKEIEIE